MSKPLPSRLAQDSSAKSSFRTEDGTEINGSSAEIPKDRTWWHATVMENFGDILRDSLCTGHQGAFKGVYSYTSWEKCAAYGGQVVFGFRSQGMVAKLSGKCSVPQYIPEGLIGYLDSGGKRQWIHHPRNVQLTQARVEYDTLRTFFAEACEKIPMNIATILMQLMLIGSRHRHSVQGGNQCHQLQHNQRLHPRFRALPRLCLCTIPPQSSRRQHLPAGKRRQSSRR